MEFDVCALLAASFILISLFIYILVRIGSLRRVIEQNELHLLKIQETLSTTQANQNALLKRLEARLTSPSDDPTPHSPEHAQKPVPRESAPSHEVNPEASHTYVSAPEAIDPAHAQQPVAREEYTAPEEGETTPAQRSDVPKPPPNQAASIQTKPKENAPKVPPKTDPKIIPKKLSIEQNLGGTLAVWGGAGALALAGALWMQYSIENNLISPLARCLLAVVVALAMGGIAEWISKRLRLVAGGLFAASIAVLYATFTSAYNLYDLISAPVCGALLCATTAGAVFASLRHDLKIIASIGLLGGFLTPIFVGAYSTSPLFSLAYILLLNSSIAFIAWRRSWPFLIHIALLFTFISELGQLTASSSTAPNVTLLLVGLLSAPFALSLHFGFSKEDPDKDNTSISKSPHLVAWLSLHASLFLPLIIGLLVGLRWGHTPYLWVQQGILLALTFALAFLKDTYRVLPFGASLLVLVHQLIHIATQDPSGAHTLTLGLTFSLLCMIGFAAIIWKRPDTVSEPVALSLVAKITLFVLFAYSPSRLVFSHNGVIPLAIAGLQGGFLAILHARYKTHKERPKSLTILPISIASLFATAAWMEFEESAFSVALSAEVIVLGVLSKHIKNRELSITGHLLAAVAFAHLLPLPNTWIFTSTTESIPFLNSMTLAYLVLASGFFLLALQWVSPLDPSKPDTTHTTISRIYGLAGTALVLILSTLTVRHSFHPAWDGSIAQSEHLSYSLSWAAVGVGALISGLVFKSKLSRLVSLALILMTTLKVFLFDLSTLEGVGRVISVAALGVVLIVIATLYRLFVLPPDEPKLSHPEYKTKSESESELGSEPESVTPQNSDSLGEDT